MHVDCLVLVFIQVSLTYCAFTQLLTFDDVFNYQENQF